LSFIVDELYIRNAQDATVLEDCSAHAGCATAGATVASFSQSVLQCQPAKGNAAGANEKQARRSLSIYAQAVRPRALNGEVIVDAQPAPQLNAA
jgi:hypothetical protein